MTKEMELIIFDLDGTLYQLDGKENGFLGSSLQIAVIENAKTFIKQKLKLAKGKADQLIEVASKDKVGISRFLENFCGIERNEYFRSVWNIDPTNIVRKYEITQKVIEKFVNTGLGLFLLTSAPRVWVLKVLNYLGILKLFKEIYCGDDFYFKSEIFNKIAQRYDPKTVLSVGDQFETDIKPAKQLGMSGILVRGPNDLRKVLEKLMNGGEK